MKNGSTLVSIFGTTVHNYPNRVFIRSADGRVYTYGDMAVRTVALGEQLLGLGLKRGERIVSFVDDVVHGALCVLACATSGLTSAALSPLFSTTYLNRTMNELGARWVMARRPHAEQLVAAGFRVLCLDEDAPPGAEGLSADPAITAARAISILRDASARTNGSDPALVQSTSGTEGAKLVLRSHRALTRYAEFVGQELTAATPSEALRFLAVAALTHSFGMHVMTTAISIGAEFDVPSEIDTRARLDEVRALDPTVLPMVPRVARALFRQHGTRRASGQPIFGPSARVVLTAGGMPDPQVLRAFEEQGLQIIEWYGSTEASLVALTPRTGRRQGYAGRIVPDAQVRLEADGELLVRSPGVMLDHVGYAPAPASESSPALPVAEGSSELIAADTALRPISVRRASAFTSDNYYRTGDLAEITSDGWLRIVGRKCALFNTPEGTNISPDRIELLLESLPWVCQAILVGDGRPFNTAFIGLDASDTSTEADGFLDPARHGAVYTRARAELRKLNAELEHIEQIRCVVLFAKALDSRCYSLIGAGKVRRNRAQFAKTYGDRISAVYGADLEIDGPSIFSVDAPLQATASRSELHETMNSMTERPAE